MGIHDAAGDTEQRRETRRLRIVVFETLRPFPALWSLWRKRQTRSNGITAQSDSCHRVQIRGRERSLCCLVG
jgi:hypothetical protein